MTIKDYPASIVVSKGTNISRDPVYTVECPAPVKDNKRITESSIEYIRADLVEDWADPSTIVPPHHNDC